MAFYFFYQPGEHQKWIPCLAEHRDEIIAQKKPALASVLNCDNSFSDEISMTQDDIEKIRYIGPMYFDFDGSDDEMVDVLESVNQLICQLEGYGVDPNCLRIFLSGKKGVHIEIAQGVFMPKVPANGIVALPDIYRELARRFDVPYLDYRVYSKKRGRMWRCENVDRGGGVYKVSITINELRDMLKGDAVAKYRELCSAPRHPVPVQPPVFNIELGTIFSSCSDTATEQRVKRKANKEFGKAAESLRAKFGKEWPETLALLGAGVIQDPEVGWNKISLQLAITAVALEKSEGELLELCSELFKAHESDSDRYNSPAKRRRDMRSMYRYVSSNPSMDYSAGALLSVVRPDCRANCDVSDGDFVRTETSSSWMPKSDGFSESSLTSDVEPEQQSSQSGETKPAVSKVEEEHEVLRFNKHGMFAKTDDGFKNISNIGFSNPSMLKRLTGEIIGYEIDTYVDGKSHGRLKLPMSSLTSKNSLNTWCLDKGASMRGTDNNVCTFVDVLRMRANKLGGPVYIIEREGVDVISPPGCVGKDQVDVIWSSHMGVLSQKNYSYKFNPAHTTLGYAESDMLLADDLSLEHEGFVSNVLEISSPQQLSKMLGWFVAATATQLIRYDLHQFPLLQVYGQAGAGKSTLVSLLNNLFYWMGKPRQIAASGQTLYPILVAVSTSASIPVVFEEMKPREMRKEARDTLKNIFRSSYRADMISRGSLGKDTASRSPVVTDYAITAPICFVGEGIESQNAILARCVVVALSESDRVGRDKACDAVKRESHKMASIGKAILLRTLKLRPNEVGDTVRKYNDLLMEKATPQQRISGVRSIFNLAVAMCGLELLGDTLREVFADKFDAKIKLLQDSIALNLNENIPRNMSEVAKVLDSIARLTRELDMHFAVIEGVDYTFSADRTSIDIKVVNVYNKYVRWQKMLGFEILFDNEDAFIAALANYAGTIRKHCPDNAVLYDSPRAKVFRLSLAQMEADEIDVFSTRG